MPIDWDNLPTLIGPRFKRLRSERFDRERLAANKHAKRKRPKNHATNQERSFIERERAAQAVRDSANRAVQWRGFKDRVRAYWLGEIEDYPS
jgi:hypothetical protein